jgi:hypothetical protein
VPPDAARGVTVLEAKDSAPWPAEFTARTRKLYAVPLVSPVTTVLVAVPEMPVTVRSTVVPRRTWTRYSLIASPPVFVGGAHCTVALASPAVAVPTAGAEPGQRRPPRATVGGAKGGADHDDSQWWFPWSRSHPDACR